MPPSDRVFQGALDLPRPGQAIPSSAVEVAGWALGAEGPIDRVEIRVGDEPPTLADIAVPRPDLAAGFPDRAHAGLAGFRAVLPVSGRGELSITARAWDGSELHEIGQALVTVMAAPARPRQVGPRTIPNVEWRADASRTVLWVVADGDVLGGSNLHLASLIGRLREPTEDHVVAVGGSGSAAPWFDATGARTIDWGPFPIGGEGYPRWVDRAATAAQGASLVVGSVAHSFPAVDIADRLGVPSVLILREPIPTSVLWHLAEPDASEVLAGRAAGAIARAGRVVLESEDVRSRHEGLTDAPVILPGVDLVEPDRVRARRRLGIGRRERLVLGLLRPEPRKGVAIVAEAFAKIAARHPKARLVLSRMEPGDPYREAVVAHIARSGLTDRVTVLPPLEDIDSWLAAADVVVCTPSAETVPRSALDAMARGIPVVASRTGHLPRLVREGETGFLCEPNDLASLTAALDRALGSPRRARARMGRAAVRAITELHHPAAETLAYRRLLDDLTGSRQLEGPLADHRAAP